MSKRAGDKLQELINNIKRNKAGGTKSTAQSVANILAMVQSSKWAEPKDLLKLIKQIGSKLMDADPMAFYIGNIVKRVIHLIRVHWKDLEEDEESDKKVGGTQYIFSTIFPPLNSKHYYYI